MNHHYAEIGHVWKHLALAELLRMNPPKHYWETHAGSASYPLTATSTRMHGAIRFLSRAPLHTDLQPCAYLEILRAMPGTYPGSALIAIRILQDRASYIFCDVDPESVETLKQTAGNLRSLVIHADGMAALRREAENSRRLPGDVLVHIDPFDPQQRVTHGGLNAIEFAGWLAQHGFRVVYWYGYESIGERGSAIRHIARLAPGARLWCGDALLPAGFVFPDRRGAWGCGIVVANGSPAEGNALGQLGAALERISADDRIEGNEPSRLGFCEI